MKRYVAGFMFHARQGVDSSVVLIQKTHPEWQEGLLNGVGGKIEEEESAPEAMTRKFREETGVPGTVWQHFATLFNDDWTVFFMRAFDRTAYDYASTQMDERIVKRVLSELGDTHWRGVIPDLQWLIPLALDASLDEPVVVRMKDG